MVRNPRWTLTREATLALAVSATFPGSVLAAEVARVQFTTGQVNATGTDGRVRTLARGADVNEGDTVNTEQGRVQLKFNDGALVSLQPRTAFRIDEYAYRGVADGTEKGFFSLLRGGLRTITGLIGRSNNDSYRVRTQTATIGIRGTEYIAEVVNSLRVSVGGGRISVTNDAGTFIIEQGQTAYVADAKSLPVIELQKPVLSPQGAGDGTDPPQLHRDVIVGENSGASTQGTPTSSHIGSFVWDGGSALNVTTGAATLSGSQLTSFSDSSSGVAYDKGTTTVQDAWFDNTVGVARWSNGTFSVTPEGGSATQVTVGANQGFHAAFGTPTPTMPTNMMATYGLLAATQATTSNGAFGLGTVAAAQGTGQPVLAVDFASGRVGTDFTVTFPDLGYRVTSTGGVNDVSASEIRLVGSTAPGVFANVLSVPTTGVSGNACTEGSCTSTDVLGFFAGDDASRAGFTYRIADGSLKVNGAVAAGPASLGASLLTQISPFAAAFASGQYDDFYQTFVGTGAGSLNRSNQLVAFSGTNDLCCTGETLGFMQRTGTFAESNYDGVIGFGRLANGTASLDGGEGAETSSTVSIGPASMDGLHMAFGVPTSPTQLAALASSGTPTATYSLLGATSATSTNLAGLGTVAAAQGTGQPILSVDFASGRVGTDFTVNFPSFGYRVTSTGGLYKVDNSEIRLTDPSVSSTFYGFNVPTTAISGGVCSDSCSTAVRGFFAGANAERAGFAYKIFDSYYNEEIESYVQSAVHGAVTASAGPPRASLLTNVSAGAVFSGSGSGGYFPQLFGGAEIFGGEGANPGTAGLNASNHLVTYNGPYMRADSFNCCSFNDDGKVHVDPGTPTYAETGYDGTVGYGRLTNGTVVVDGGEGSGTTTLSATQGLHYVFGSITPAAPASLAMATYSLLGATNATSDSGTLGLGTFTGSLAVDFNTRRVGTDFSVAFPSTTYRVATTGGVTNVLASEMSLSDNSQGLVFGQSLGSSNVTKNAAACSSGCQAYLLGFFAGTNAERAGMGYRILDSDTGQNVSGAAAFTVSGSSPPLGGSNISLNYAGAHDIVPPSNSSDSFKHLNTTGSIDATTGALTMITEGGATTATVGMAAEAGRDDSIGWTRWTSGTLGGAGAHAGSVLSGNLSFHSVYGTPTSAADMTALQTSGLGVTYSLIGKTSPTDALGSTAPGTLTSGSMIAWFGTQVVDVSLGVSMPSTSYSVNATGLPISGSGFGGTTNNVSGSCSGCSANIQGFFAGSMAARAGVAYTISNMGSPVVNGAAAFGRTGTVAPIP